MERLLPPTLGSSVNADVRKLICLFTLSGIIKVTVNIKKRLARLSFSFDFKLYPNNTNMRKPTIEHASIVRQPHVKMPNKQQIDAT
ncbi:hypothetical protein PRLR6025_26120 [Prevotella lacticifex]|nr:hypothetical protein PRLR6025_26120 [Prevotella lacticifex]